MAIWRRWIVGSVVVGAALWLVYEPAGYLAVQYQCARNGGLTVSRPVEPTGFLDMQTDDDCVNCYVAYLLGLFQFAEHKALRSGLVRNEPTPGIYRYSLVQSPDVRCRGYKAFPSDKFPENTCVSVERVEAVSAPYVYEFRREKVNGGLGVDLVQIEQRMTDRASGEVVAQLRHFGRLSTVMSTFFGVTKFQWECSDTARTWMDPKYFFSAVLGASATKPPNWN